MRPIVLRPEAEGSGLWTPQGDPISVGELPLSDRVVAALADWVSFFRELDGDLEDPQVLHEFISQGYKIGHGIRRELKGSTVWLHRVDTGELVSIELRRPR